MKYNEKRANDKRNEAIHIIESALNGMMESRSINEDQPILNVVATEIVDNLVRIVPPKEPEMRLDLVRMAKGGIGGAQSVKPGNLRINIGKFITAIAGGVLTIASIPEIPWAAPFAAIVIWDSLWSGLKIEITERDACVLWTLWKNKDINNCVPNVGLLDRVNAELERNGRAAISHQEFENSTEKLKMIRCIKRSKNDKSKWWLKEWVSVEFR